VVLQFSFFLSFSPSFFALLLSALRCPDWEDHVYLQCLLTGHLPLTTQHCSQRFWGAVLVYGTCMHHASGQLVSETSPKHGLHFLFLFWSCTIASFVGQQAGQHEVESMLMFIFVCASQFKAAQFLRLAEQKGHKTLGNTWYVRSAFAPFLFSFLSLSAHLSHPGSCARGCNSQCAHTRICVPHSAMTYRVPGDARSSTD
jgi:hypothetical protein